MAVTEYNEKTFNQLTGAEKSTFSILRLFNILLDSDRETKFMNIFRSYILNDDILTNVAFYDRYEVANGEFWDNISFNLYGTPYLWWILAILNNVANPFEELEEGQTIKVLRSDYIYSITKDLEKIAES